MLSVRHSLHRKPAEAKGFYAVYCGLIALSAALVLTPRTPLGLLTNAVQTLAGVLLPSATVFLLLLCNDKAVLGPWANGRKLNLFTGAVIAVLVMLSIILTASVLFSSSTRRRSSPLVGGSVLAAVTAIGVTIYERRRGPRGHGGVARRSGPRDVAHEQFAGPAAAGAAHAAGAVIWLSSSCAVISSSAAGPSSLLAHRPALAVGSA